MLAIPDMQEADLIFVPVDLRVYDGCGLNASFFEFTDRMEGIMQAFMDNARTYLPLLGQKPHILVLHATAVHYGRVPIF